LSIAQGRELLGKIAVDSIVQEVPEVNDGQLRFYRKYAAVTDKTLRRPSFLGFLGWMLREESIEGNMISEVKVMMFPSRNGKGNGLAGKITGKGEIFLYPKRKEFCRRLMRDFERNNVFFFIKARAMATLIHELLHLRYLSDERVVRQKTEEYFQIFIWEKYMRDMETRSILKMLFSSDAVAC
jgi:hypothetical protein